MFLLVLVMFFSLVFLVSLSVIHRAKDSNLPAVIVCAIPGLVAIGGAFCSMAPLFALF